VTGWSQLLSLHRFVEIATHAGKLEDAASYNATLTKLKAAYHTHYWDDTTKSYGPSQTANLLPLYLDITPAELVEAATEAYVGAVLAHGNHTNSGIIGAAYMLQTLKKVGRGDLALTISLGTTMPSWGFMVLQGPGTIWETWDDTSNSHNHPALSADIGVFLYSLAGLEPEHWGLGALRRVKFELDQTTARQVGAAQVSATGVTGGIASFSWAFERNSPPVVSEKPRSSFELNASVPHGEDRARSHCRFVLPLYTRFANIFGASIPEPTMRPNPR
jgi:alpha-L-rhamnosidase